MNVYQKLMLDRKGLTEHGPINIVIFGDSISHGAFNGYIDFESVYWNILRRKLNALRTYIPVNTICTAIGGTTATKSLSRLEKQVLVHCPDLVIVCFGLNDVNGPLEDYTSALRTIFSRCKENGADVIFMTPNMMNTYVAEDTPKEHLSYAYVTAEMQNSGKVDLYIDAAKALAEELALLTDGFVIKNPKEVFENAVEYLHIIIDPRVAFAIIIIVCFLIDIAARKFKWKWPHEIIRDKKRIEAKKNTAEGAR
jgi:lysophospholipase L1-like esterase